MNPNDTKNTVGTDISASPPLWKKILNTVFFHTCAYFTVFTLILLIIQASAGDGGAAYVKPSRFLLVLPFALFIALADVSSGQRVDSDASHSVAGLDPLWNCDDRLHDSNNRS